MGLADQNPAVVLAAGAAPDDLAFEAAFDPDQFAFRAVA